MQTLTKAGLGLPSTSRRRRWRPVVLALLAAFGPSLLAVPAQADAAQQFVITLVDSPTAFVLEDPCRGGLLTAVGTENGTTRTTDLGAQGFHTRVQVRGDVQLFAAGTLVGTWSYRLSYLDQFPPGGQGAVTQIASGPLVYTDGTRAMLMVHEHQVFGQGDVLKRDFSGASCGGA